MPRNGDFGYRVPPAGPFTARRVLATLVRNLEQHDAYWNSASIAEWVMDAAEWLSRQYEFESTEPRWVRFLADTANPELGLCHVGDERQVAVEYVRDYEALGFAEEIDSPATVVSTTC